MHWCKSTIVNAAAVICAAGLFLPGLVVAEGSDSSCFAINSDHEHAADQPHGLFLATIGDESGVVAELRCKGGSVRHVGLRAEPGQRADVAMLLANAGVDAVVIGSAMSGDAAWTSEWVHVEVFHGAVPAGGFLPLSLAIHVPADFTPGTRSEHQFELVDGDEAFTLTVGLEVIEEQSMFRDGFEVDPVLGQFSYRTEVDLNPGS